MSLRIVHTGDVHIGLKFNRYPEIKEDLIEARFSVLDSLIHFANENEAQLFIIAGDLFDKVRIAKADIIRTANIINKFAGNCLAILPGNHDYDDGQGDLWTTMKDHVAEHVLLLNKYQPYHLSRFGLDSVIYPAFCDAKHSAENRLTWINSLAEQPQARWHIGVAHGALTDISPDVDGRYFNMNEAELRELGLDLWCLGHTHIPYPANDTVENHRVFNSGTPEPDGLDCKHGGSSWLIEIGNDKQVEAKRLNEGRYRFMDVKKHVTSLEDLEAIGDALLDDKATHTVLRLALAGRVEQDVLTHKQQVYDRLAERLAYFIPHDLELKLKITAQIIEKEFSEGSFPFELLSELATQEDEKALQLAYELIKDVK